MLPGSQVWEIPILQGSGCHESLPHWLCFYDFMFLFSCLKHSHPETPFPFIGDFPIASRL